MSSSGSEGEEAVDVEVQEQTQKVSRKEKKAAKKEAKLAAKVKLPDVGAALDDVGKHALDAGKFAFEKAEWSAKKAMEAKDAGKEMASKVSDMVGISAGLHFMEEQEVAKKCCAVVDQSLQLIIKVVIFIHACALTIVAVDLLFFDEENKVI
jgi:hypothetical protein